MAINDDATLVINSGNFYTATTGTAIPADLTAPGVAWTNVGHTSLEDIFGLSSEGGETTVIGTLQNAALRTRQSDRSELMTFTLQQFDEEGLLLYYGSNATVQAGPPARVEVPTNPTPTTCAFLAVFIDGTNEFAFYAPKAEIYRNDDLSLSDTESLAGLPLGIRPLVNGTNDWTYAVTSLGGA
jgi:hypothetical protein